MIIKSGTLISVDKGIREAVLPAYMKSIGAGTFRNCGALRSVTWQGEPPQIDKNAFQNCPKLILPASVYTGKALPPYSLTAYMPDDGEVFANILLLTTAKGKYLAAAAEKLTENEPVRVAHPMEMTPETTEAWQQYFTSHGLKQPFEQIWEPVVDAALVKPGRYDGCTIPLYMLMNKEKHGIIMERQSQITLADCSAGLRLVEGHHDWVNNDFEVTDFRFDEFSRQVNHIVVYLDKGTVAGRIRKDDISAAQWFDRFTLAQITDFIRLAQENNAVNVLTQLLEYKNAHFADFDPMDEFTLDLI